MSIPTTNSKGWNILWSLKLPHKIRTFLWHFCKNNVPIRKLLKSKRVAVPIICFMCEHDIEHLLHIFFDCNFVTKCWRIVDLDFNRHSIECTSTWLLDGITNFSADEVKKIVTVLWGVWFAENKKVWKSTMLTSTVTMDIGRKLFKGW